jgi:hypothetical protein
VSQPWQEKTGSARGTGEGNASPPGRPGGTWSRSRIALTGQPQAREPGGGRPAEPDGGKDGRASASQRPGSRLTGRGALLGMFVLFFLGLLVATWLGLNTVAGAIFVLGCAAAARWTQPRDLLGVAVSPPILFFCALLCVKTLTASGNTLVSVAGGATLALANVAPWLLAGVAISLIIAWFRGLPRCVSDLRRAARGERLDDRGRPAGSPRPTGNARPSASAGEQLGRGAS